MYVLQVPFLFILTSMFLLEKEKKKKELKKSPDRGIIRYTDGRTRGIAYSGRAEL